MIEYIVIAVESTLLVVFTLNLTRYERELSRVGARARDAREEADRRVEAARDRADERIDRVLDRIDTNPRAVLQPGAPQYPPIQEQASISDWDDESWEAHIEQARAAAGFPAEPAEPAEVTE